MDWELYERQRATLVFIGVAIICFLLLAFQRSSAVQHIKGFFVSCTFPAQRLFSRLTSSAPAEKLPDPAPAVSPEASAVSPEGVIDSHAEHARALRVLSDQNSRLGELLDLKRNRWPQLVSARVVSRDPQKWFQELLLDKGEAEGIQEDDSVIAITGTREALVGRILEVGTHSSRVMLVYDSLSSVAAAVAGANAEDGVVEGSNSHDLYLKYLSRDSQIKIGDMIVTSGLGKTFPEGIPIGWVREIELDQRQLFLQARLSPALASQSLRVVGILVRKE
jgi:rod shape-determining protein MreC